MKIVMISWFLCGFISTLLIIYFRHSPIVTSEAIQYLEIIKGFLCLYVSAIKPIKLTYSPNSIIPFPLNEECIKSLEMALLMPTSANYFYNFLENFC